MSVLDQVAEAIFSSFIDKPGVLMGDDDFHEIMETLKKEATHHGPGIMSCQFFTKNDIHYFGAKIMTNAIPGSRGWIIGRLEDVERMREAVWMSSYIKLFKDTPDGMKHAYAKP